MENDSDKRAEIEATVIRIICRLLDVEPEQVKLDTALVDLGEDSIDHVETVMLFEEEFDISIPDDESDRLTTVRECVDYLFKNRPES